MFKRIQKRLTVVIIVSMLLQLFAGVSPVLAEDSSDPTAEPEFVPILAATLSPGETAGATSATVADYVYGNLLVNVTEQEVATPQAGDAVPTAGDNLITDYEPGTDIITGVVAGNYLQIYDVEMNEDAKVIAFYQTEITEDDINGVGQGKDTGLTVALGYAYIDENGGLKFTRTNTVTKISPDTTILNGGWYIVEGNINTGTAYSTGQITVNGNVHLILANGSSLTVNGGGEYAGIYVPKDKSLTIYAQSKGNEMGSLNALGNAQGNYGFSAGIGGRYMGASGIIGERFLSCGDIIINGGRITAIGGSFAAGIGGGSNGYGGNITINNGIISAAGGDYAAGIGGGYKSSGGNIIINGGEVTATGGSNGAGIGGGAEGYYGEIIIDDSAASINAQGSFGGEDIGNGKLGEGATIIRRGDAKGIDSPDAGLEAVAGFGSALNFPLGSRARIDIPQTFNTSISGFFDFTISMWIFPNENEPYQTLYRQYNANTFSTGAWLRFIKSNNNEGYLYFGMDANTLGGGWQWIWDWNGGIPPSNIAKIPFHQWTHVALVKFGRSITLYANGVKYSEMTLDDTHYHTDKPNSCNISIGGSSVDDQFFSGKLDEIGFWNTPLTSDEIKTWMFREIDITHPKYNSLTFYYGLNKKSGPKVFDSKGEYIGLHSTMVNMTESNYVTSDIADWSVEAGSVLAGELVGSHARGSSNNGLDWNLTFEIVEQGKKGTATITSDNKFEYKTNDMSQKGHDSFTYRVKGSDVKYSNIETVNLNIIPKTIQNWPPTSDDSDRHDRSEGDKPVDGKTKKDDTITTTVKDGKKTTTVIMDEKVEEELKQKEGKKIITISDTSGADTVVGTLNGQTIKNMAGKDAVLEIKSGQVTYTLPASQINIDAVSEQIGKQVELKDIAVSVMISEPAEDTVKIALDTANKNNCQIIVKPIEFEITCSSGSKTIEITKFNAYVERMIAIPEGVDPSKITTGVVLNSDGTFSPVPTVITMIDGKYYAKINSLTNSTYAVIYSPKSFKDVAQHWAEKNVNDMASRLVVSGISEDKFEPDRDITRAEFATIVVKALGLMSPGSGKDAFIDVVKKSWYYDAVSIAHEYGITSGYENGNFGPDDKINREQAMTMIAKAMKLTGSKVELADGEADELLTGFTDVNQAAEYAKTSLASCVKAGIVSGRNGKLIAPKDNIARAEVAVIVQRLLQNSNLI